MHIYTAHIIKNHFDWVSGTHVTLEPGQGIKPLDAVCRYFNAVFAN